MVSRVLRAVNAERLKVGLRPIPPPQPAIKPGEVKVNHYRLLETASGPRLIKVEKP